MRGAKALASTCEVELFLRYFIHKGQITTDMFTFSDNWKGIEANSRQHRGLTN